MTPFYVTDIPGRDPSKAHLMDGPDKDVVINMGQVIQSFIGAFILARGAPPERLCLSDTDTDELCAFLYLAREGKIRSAPPLYQGVKLELDCERTCLT